MNKELININNSSKNNQVSNKIKKDTGSIWRKNENSKILSTENFDFSKKILYHPEKIAAYKEGKRPFPTTIEIDLTNKCNHRCDFCYYAEHIGMEADKPSLDTDLLKERLIEAKKLGTKAISFTGGGEPTIHKDYLELIKFTNQIGLDVGTITNGSAITERNVDIIIKNLQWIRISMAGGDRESYSRVQGVDQFEKILSNLKLLSKRKEMIDPNFNVGIRTLVTPDNIHSLEQFAEIIKNLNLNYWQVAPNQFTDDKGKFWNDENTQRIFSNVKDILAEGNVKLLTTTYMASQEKLDYPTTCYAHFFMVALTAEGYLTFCKNVRSEKDFHIGDITKNTLTEIWNGDKTKEIESWVRPNNCGLFCKHMAINDTMEDIVSPSLSMSPNFVG
jgi:cyclic pyranopterin phosphate synthase|tara:strand:+ start:165 stop:1331 length:1167 start_codon:yes stop_codon:yes gene_type:complete